MCHCERSEAISRDCHVASLLAMTTFQDRSLYIQKGRDFHNKMQPSEAKFCYVENKSLWLKG